MSAISNVVVLSKHNSLVNEGRYSGRIRRLAVCILMNSLSNLVFQWRKSLWENKERTSPESEKEREEGEEGVAGDGGGGGDGGRGRRRGEPEPEMAARWLLLLLALLAAHAAALPDFIRIGEYLSQLPPL